MALELLAIGALIAGLGGASWGLLKHRRGQLRRIAPGLRAPWDDAAQTLGLTLEATELVGRRSYRMRGVVDGHAVSVAFEVRGELAWPPMLAPGGSLPDTHIVPPGQTTVSVAVRAPLPRGLHLRRETAATEALRYAGIHDILLGDSVLDGTLHVRCDAPRAAVAMAAHPSGRAALQAVARSESIEVADQRITDRRPGELPDRLDAMIRGVLAVAVGLEAAACGPIDAVAAARGLSRSTHDGAPSAAGQVRGHAVRLTRGPDGTELTVHPSRPPPSDLRVAARHATGGLGEPGGAGAPVRLANPILGRLVDARAADPDAVALWLADALTEPLLAVIQGHPGARIDHGVVHLDLPAEATAEALDAAVEDALRLADAWAP